MGILFEKIGEISQIYFSLFLVHLKILHNDLDSVKSNQQNYSPSGNHSKYNWQYLFPFLVGLYVLADTAVIFIANGGHYSYKEMPQLFTHLINPYEFWQISDVTMGLGLILLPTIYGCLIFKPGLNLKYQMHLTVNPVDKKSVRISQNGVFLNLELSWKIYRFRKRARKIINMFMVVAWFQAAIFYVRNFLLQWTDRPRSYWMFAVIVTFYFYAIFGN